MFLSFTMCYQYFTQCFLLTNTSFWPQTSITCCCGLQESLEWLRRPWESSLERKNSDWPGHRPKQASKPKHPTSSSICSSLLFRWNEQLPGHLCELDFRKEHDRNCKTCTLPGWRKQTSCWLNAGFLQCYGFKH